MTLLCLVFLSSCSSVKVLDSWTADKVKTIKDNKVLVIARTDNNQARIAFETEITNALKEKGIDASESFKIAPKLTPNKELTPERKAMIKSLLKSEGYNGIVLSVIKDFSEQTKTTQDGGYYAGGTFSTYYPRYYGGFYGYYSHPLSYSSYGNYVPLSYTTRTSKTYILETVAYNLDLPKSEQLVAVVTSKIEDPSSVQTTASDYVKAIMKSISNKK